MALSKQQWQSNTEFTRPKYQLQLSDTGEESVSITYVVHNIFISDVDDPDLCVADPIFNWQQTDAGKWVMKNSNPKPSWHRHMDYNTYGYIYQIRAYLSPKQLTYFKLKFE
jgi:uncharacterized protein YvpB